MTADHFALLLIAVLLLASGFWAITWACNAIPAWRARWAHRHFLPAPEPRCVVGNEWRAHAPRRAR